MPSDILPGLDAEAVLAAGMPDLDEFVPTVESPFVPKHAPEWAAKHDRRKPKAKRGIYDRAPNHCKCHGYAATGKAPKRAERPETATDLCVCQVKLAFLAQYPNPVSAECLRGMFLLGKLREPLNRRDPFEMPTEEDMGHVEWVIDLHRDEWTAEAQRDKCSPEEHELRRVETCRRIGMTDAEIAYWSESATKQRESQRHHTR